MVKTLEYPTENLVKYPVKSEAGSAHSLFDYETIVALAAGEIHNKLVEDVLDRTAKDAEPPDEARAALAAAVACGLVRRRDERWLEALIEAVDLDRRDFGLAEMQRLGRRAIAEDAAPIVILSHQIAVASTEFGLRQLGDSSDAQARRRVWRIILGDLGGAFLGWLGSGGSVVGAIGGAVAGSINAANS